VSVSSKDLMRIVEGQAYRCALSGVDLSPRMSSLDHKTPASRGGSNELDNLQVIHPVVNYSKARLNNEEFIAMCHAVARTHQDTGNASWADKMMHHKSGGQA